MLNVNFTHEGTNYNVTLVPRENYYIHPVKFGDKEFSVRVSFTNNYIAVYRVEEDPFSTEDNQVYVQKIKENKVRASEFLKWYLSDSDDYLTLGASVSYKLFESGSATIKVVDLFNECAYIPSRICDQKTEGDKEYKPCDLLFYDDLSKPNLSDNQKMYYYERETSNI